MTQLTVEGIRHLLATNDKAVCRAVVRLYQRQTPSERRDGTTLEDNGIGFTGSDAYAGKGDAEFILRNGFLCPDRIAYWRAPSGVARGATRIGKYARQLLEVAQEKTGEKLLKELA